MKVHKGIARIFNTLGGQEHQAREQSDHAHAVVVGGI